MLIVYYIGIGKSLSWLLESIMQDISEIFLFLIDIPFFKGYLSLTLRFSQFRTFLQYL